MERKEIQNVVAKKIIDVITGIFMGILTTICGALVSGYILMWLWNKVMEGDITNILFGIDKLKYWRSFGLTFLCGILFKGYRITNK